MTLVLGPGIHVVNPVFAGVSNSCKSSSNTVQVKVTATGSPAFLGSEAGPVAGRF